MGLLRRNTFRTSLLVLAAASVLRLAPAIANGRMPQSIKVAFRPRNQTDVLLGVTFGFILSRDDGATWRWGCEAAVGFQGTFDPDYELTSSGTIVATTFTGLRLTRDGCAWTAAPMPLGERLVTAVTVAADGAIYAGAADPSTGSGVYKSVDDAVSFQPTSDIGQTFDWFDTLEVAPSDSRRVYLTGYRLQAGLPRRTIMARSLDGGDSWDVLSTAAFQGTEQSEVKIAAVAPNDPDVVFVRVTLVANLIQEAIYRTSNWSEPVANGGPSWTKVLELPAYMPGVVARQSGEVLVATSLMGVYRSVDGGLTFDAVPGATYDTTCLAERASDQTVWMCANQLPPDRMALGSTPDPAVAPWTVRIRYDQINGPVRCGPGTVQHDSCEVALWCGLKEQFGNTSGEVDCSVDAGPGASPPPKGCCDGNAAPGAEVGAALAVLFLRRRRRSRVPGASLTALAVAALAACSGDTARSVEELMNPEACAECHPKHFREWSGSMHAYAADDPVFLAMNRLGQQETEGALGDFCVQCHAPVAQRLGLTTDGLNLDAVPQWAKGVTCYFCHNAVEVSGEHNNPIVLAMDQTMRAGVSDPVRSPAHFTEYSPLIDADRPESSPLCGSCHDIVTPAGVHLERTFAEWKETIFGQDNPRTQLSCAQCHMIVSTDVIAEADGLDVPLRPFGRREHTFAAVDVALTPWPEREAQLAAINRDLRGVLLPRLCVVPQDAGRIDYRLDNIGAGHMFPSGATADRRIWAEIIAYDENDQVVFSSGVLPEENLRDPEELGDPNLWLLGTDTRDAAGQPTELFWRVATIDHPGNLLKPAVTTDPQDPRFYHAVERSYPVPGLLGRIRRITARVLARPIPMRLLEELRASGHLGTDLRSEVPTHVLSATALEWRAGGEACVP